jgi:hypothetical protein
LALNSYIYVQILIERGNEVDKDFEKCCNFLAQMMEKYGGEVLKEIALEKEIKLECWVLDANGRKSRLIAYAKRFMVYQKRAV